MKDIYIPKPCCICGKTLPCWNNPDPIREGDRDCCEACNQLVRSARRRMFNMRHGEMEAFIRKLREMDYSELKALLEEHPDGFC